MMSSSAAPIGEAAADLELLNEQVLRLGENAQTTADAATSAFEHIGAVASNQVGSIAGGAFDAYADAMATAAKTGDFSAKSFEKAMKATLANSLKSIGQEATVQALFETAKGVASLASPITAAEAPGHFLAAAQFVGVAAAAGAAAGALGGGSGGSSSSPGPRDGAEDPTGTETDGGDDVFQTVTVIGVLDVRDAEALDSQLAEAKNRRDLS